MRFAELDAVTIDGFGTLVRLVDPLPALQSALRELGVERSDDQVRDAFHAEARYYRAHSVRGRDEASLAALRDECVSIFLRELGADLDDFRDAFIACLRFDAVDGAVETVHSLRARGLALAVVANWDVSLHEHLDALSIAPLFDTVVTSADAGVAKPDPEIFRFTLARLGVPAARALHVGDEELDEQGAQAAGLRYLPAPLATAFDGWSA